MQIEELELAKIRQRALEIALLRYGYDSSLNDVVIEANRIVNYILTGSIDNAG